MKYWGPVRALGGAALITFIIGLIFPFIHDGITDPTLRDGVLLYALPFVAFFISVLLLYILLIVVVVRFYNGRIPNRAFSPILAILVIGIAGGVFFLFQPFTIVGYRYGFLLLLVSTLGFILWSHILPKNARFDADLPKLSPLHHGIAVVVAAAVFGVLMMSAIAVNQPTEPYGVRQRVWDRYDDARKADIAAAAAIDFDTVQLPFLVLLNLFPAAAIYFVAREVVNAFAGGQTRADAPPRPARGRT